MQLNLAWSQCWIVLVSFFLVRSAGGAAEQFLVAWCDFLRAKTSAGAFDSDCSGSINMLSRVSVCSARVLSPTQRVATLGFLQLGASLHYRGLCLHVVVLGHASDHQPSARPLPLVHGATRSNMLTSQRPIKGRKVDRSIAGVSHHRKNLLHI